MAAVSGGYAAGRDVAPARHAASSQEKEHYGLGRDRFQEIVREFNDILRVGRLIIDGNPVTWEVSGGNERDLNSFIEAFRGHARELNARRSAYEGQEAFRGHGDQSASIETSPLGPNNMGKMVYSICKALSINYVLSEILVWLTRLLDCKKDGVVTVNMEKDRMHGPKADYFVDILDNGLRCRVGLLWSWAGNIVEVSPSGTKVERGTLSRVQTEFKCPPDHDFKPVYSLRFNLKKSKRERLTGAVCGAAQKVVGQGRNAPSSFHIDVGEPLRSRHSIAEELLKEHSEATTSLPSASSGRRCRTKTMLELAEGGVQTAAFGLRIDEDYALGEESPEAEDYDWAEDSESDSTAYYAVPTDEGVGLRDNRIS